MREMFPTVRCLPPPYQVSRPLIGAAPLGAMLIASMATGPGALEAAAGAWQANPWCPLVVTLGDSAPIRSPLLVGLVGLVRQCPWLTAVACAARSEPPVRVIVQQRPSPNARDIGRYIAMRIRSLDAERWFTLACCSTASSDLQPTPDVASASADTIRRRLREYGPLGPRDWVALAETIAMLHNATASSIRSIGQLAADHHLDPRTVRARLIRLVGSRYEAALARVGWEWVLEAVLRKWGYVECRDQMAS